MNKLIRKRMTTVLLLAVGVSSIAYASSKFATSEELRDKYPNITDQTERVENKKILCPFHRMMERAGVYDDKNRSSKAGEIIVSLKTVIDAAKEFGCRVVGCGTVGTAVSVGQNSYASDVLNGYAKFGRINVTRLHKARGVAHDCGLTFEKGGSEISDKRRSKTLARLKELSKQGRLVKEDLMTVKKEICAEENVSMTLPGKVEMGLIFKYLGGEDRGFIEYSDVERLLHAKMPLTKSIEGI